jgi:hypothetical protein
MERGRGSPSRVLLASAALVLTALPASADEARPPVEGPRVRVTLASSGRKQTGRLLDVNDDVLVLGKEKSGGVERLKIPRLDVSTLEVSERRSRKGHGAAIGALVGAGVAVAVGVAAGESCPAQRGVLDICFSRGETALLTGILTVPLGALVGALASHGERWRVADPARFSLGVGPGPGGGVAARVALRF